MSSLVNVAIHASQVPENVRRDLLESLRTRRVNHKFHYDSIRQTNAWLALHQAYSPSRDDSDCPATYDRALAEAARQIDATRVHLLGLGCGGGQKDTRLLKLLQARGCDVFYTPSDVSVAMTLVARRAALAVIPAANCFPLVCDLVSADDLPAVCAEHQAPDSARLVTFFGMIPNFAPAVILPKLVAFIRPRDTLLFSANLAPGADYAAGVEKILPQYDNPLTREWLLAFLLDLGVERGDGELKFTIESSAAAGELKRVVARFHFGRARELLAEGERFEFGAGDAIQLFFSYRYTPELVRAHLARVGLRVSEQWLAQSGEEGVFLCRRA